VAGASCSYGCLDSRWRKLACRYCYVLAPFSTGSGLVAAEPRRGARGVSRIGTGAIFASDDGHPH
jgi:hypothetical protein